MSEKIIQADIVQKFLRIFRDTQDAHRVLVVIPLTLFLSHSWFLKSAPQVSLVASRINPDEMFWLILAGSGVLFVLCWAIFSSPFNPSLYVRQSIFIIWTGLAHRWFYGLEIPGTPYLTAISLLALTSYLPFAFWGLRPDQLFSKIKDEYQEKKNTRPAVVEVPVSSEPQRSESDAA
jgi:hypothetical protein